MAITTLKAKQIVDAAALLLQREIVLPRLVWTQPNASFVGSLDDTITLRVPGAVTANARTMRSNAPLTFGNLAQTSVPVQLTTHINTLLPITDEELTLDIRDFSAEVLQPQVRSVAEGTEDVIAAQLVAATVAADQQFTYAAASAAPFDLAVDLNAKLNTLNVPRQGRVIVVGANVEADFLKDDKLSKVNESGSPSALRDAVIGRVAGFQIVGSNAIDPNKAYAFHRSAIAFANVAPALPAGATMAERVASNGVALRYLRDYDPTNATGPVDRSLVDAFVGAASVEQGGNNSRLLKVSRTA